MNLPYCQNPNIESDKIDGTEPPTTFIIFSNHGEPLVYYEHEMEVIKKICKSKTFAKKVLNSKQNKYVKQFAEFALSISENINLFYCYYSNDYLSPKFIF